MATVALGFTANALVLSVVSAVLVNPLPWDSGPKLVHVSGLLLSGGSEAGPDEAAPYPLSYLDIRELSESAQGFEGIVPRTGARSFNLLADARAENVRGELVGSGYFDLLGLVPAEGRFLRPEEDLEGEHRVVILGHGLWTRSFGADPTVLGRTLELDGRTFEIVGVAPPGFRGLSDEAELWMPITMASALYGPFYLQSRQFRWLSAVGSRGPGLSLENAAAQLTAAAADLRDQYPQTNRDIGVASVSLTEHLLGDVRPKLLILWGSAALVLLIATANLSALLLARGISTARQSAIRGALGAGRWSLARESVVDALVVVAVGLLVGLVTAAALVGPAVRSAGALLPDFVDISLSPQVIAVMGVLACLTAVGAGAVPALLASRVSALAALSSEGRSPGIGRGQKALFRGLVSAQIATALALAVSVALLVQGFSNLVGGELGFDPEGVIMATVDLKAPRFQPNSAYGGYARQLHERVQSLTGVRSAALVGPQRPVGDWNSAEITVEARAEMGLDPNGLIAVTHSISPDYFEAMGIDLQEGRDFTEGDSGEFQAPLVVIVNRSFADRYLEGPAIGARIKLSRPDQNGPVGTVIGVVDDVVDGGPGAEPRPTELQIYYSLYQIIPRLPPLLTVVARLEDGVDPGQAQAELRALAADVAPDIPLFDLETLDAAIREQTTTQRFLVSLMVAFAILAAILALIGLYGMVSFTIAHQTHEIGVRMAIGATPGRVLGLVVSRALGVASVGVVAGLGLALALLRLIEPHLYGARPDDLRPWVLASMGALLITTLASLAPALRAARTDPTVSLGES